MGDKRKLQSEIDRTLKKIDEGLDVYDRIYQKVVDAESQSNKEKYEVRMLARASPWNRAPADRGAAPSRRAMDPARTRYPAPRGESTRLPPPRARAADALPPRPASVPRPKKKP